MSEIPDTGMATGNDEGEPGQPDTRPLDPEERRLLAALERPADGPAEPAVEDVPGAPAAEGYPLPAKPDDGGDGLEPQFTDR
jgi:hypothetical protein